MRIAESKAWSKFPRWWWWEGFCCV